ncbi:HAD family hydrolase [Paenibacillus cymbidii]|uniref:HAD family hydrolase n=1 Tax=Paenibacillus cymbidii TaxID=1639034 RepID=UPI00108075CE|nr:HAD-IA family hydrolase [Paenibacillus cymbidii]
MRYKAILFDLDNTLLNYSLSELKSMQGTVEAHGLVHRDTFSWDTFWTLFCQKNFAYWSDRRKSGYSIHEVLELSFRDTLQGLDWDHADSKPLAQLYWSTFCASCEFEAHAKEILTRLYGSYRLAIISNGIGEAQRSRLAAGGVIDLFDTLTVSDEVGYWKPEREIFDETLKRLQIRPAEALFIGDSLHDDYNGAINAGIDFCYYNRSGAQVDPDVRPKYIIDSLLHLDACLVD